MLTRAISYYSGLRAGFLEESRDITVQRIHLIHRIHGVVGGVGLSEACGAFSTRRIFANAIGHNHHIERMISIGEMEYNA